ncbi:porin [Acetohalobium arabaticum]|uniref:Porin domain-containing protein n=1 Tax=Acetohalobium arabaticum (strain ATCC 49924 / DSM 5501 / Z-7288) TaxID=574087 RepID=D9QQY4_ACEAZ|nr:hypothetical protein [Acetohalobium arabaticum]ADL12925.1 hypothetical protein Acear_1415 [Acetohalobium arabaticum DSM 5501]
MKKFSILLALVLVLGLAVPAMAAADVDVSTTVGVENVYDDSKDESSATEGYLYLFLEGNPTENVNFYSEIDFTGYFDGNKNEEDVDVYEAWIEVDEVVGPVDVKLGRMYEESADNVLYEYDSDDFVRLGYEAGNVSAKFGHNLDSEGDDAPATAGDSEAFAEFKATDLGLLDQASLNYTKDNNLTDADGNATGDSYEGYTVKLTNDFDVVDASLLYGTADGEYASGNDWNESADITALGLSTDQLFPGATLSLDYADVEENFVKAEDQDSYLNDTVTGDDFDMIKPGVNFDLTDKTNVDFSYAMYSADNDDADDDYLDLLITHNVAENTTLEVELEDHSYDGSNITDDDETIITTTLETNF